MRLKDRVALMTSAGRGIGRTISIALAREEANVVVNDVNLKSAEETVEELEAMGYNALPIKANVADRTEVIQMVEKVIALLNKIDILVNNAECRNIFFLPFGQYDRG